MSEDAHTESNDELGSRDMAEVDHELAESILEALTEAKGAFDAGDTQTAGRTVGQLAEDLSSTQIEVQAAIDDLALTKHVEQSEADPRLWLLVVQK